MHFYYWPPYWSRSLLPHVCDLIHITAQPALLKPDTWNNHRTGTPPLSKYLLLYEQFYANSFWSSISKNWLLFSALFLDLETKPIRCCRWLSIVGNAPVNFCTNISSTFPNDTENQLWSDLLLLHCDVTTCAKISFIFLGTSVCFLLKDQHNYVWNLAALRFSIET